MQKFLRLLALSLFAAASVAYVGCEPAADTKKSEQKSEDKKDEKKDDKTSQAEQVPDGMVLVSLKVPAMH